MTKLKEEYSKEVQGIVGGIFAELQTSALEDQKRKEQTMQNIKPKLEFLADKFRLGEA